jgi:type II secretory pathway pseudopilin PulG
MKILLRTQRISALTLLEILVVIAVLGLLAAMLLPAMVRMKAHDQRVRCVNNTVQIGLAFRVWEDDAGAYPMAVSQAKGGSLEFTTGLNAWHHFQVLSNQLVTTSILVCPTDKSRTAAPDFASLRNANLSYFVGINATNENMPEMILSGDRNVTNGSPVKNGMLAVSTNAPAGWTSSMHVRVGDLVLADGSVQQIGNSSLRVAIQRATNAPTLLQMPVTP